MMLLVRAMENIIYDSVFLLMHLSATWHTVPINPASFFFGEFLSFVKDNAVALSID